MCKRIKAVSQDVVRIQTRKAVSLGTHVDMRIFAVSRSNMDSFVSDIVLEADIVFPHLKPMFIDLSEAVGRLGSGENFGDLNDRRVFNPKLKSELNPVPSSTKVSALASSASFSSCGYRYNQDTSDNVGLDNSSEQIGTNESSTTKAFSVNKKSSVPLRKLITTSCLSESKNKVKAKVKAAIVPLETLNVSVSNKRKEKTIPKITKKSNISKKFDKDKKLVGLGTGKGASTNSSIGASSVALIDKPAGKRPVVQ